MIEFADYAKPVQAAALLGINEETVRRFIREGKLPSVRWGRQLLIPRAELEEFAKTYDPNRKSKEAQAAYAREQAQKQRKQRLGHAIKAIRSNHESGNGNPRT